MTVRCRAAGGPPTPQISWTFPDKIEEQGVTTVSNLNTLEDGSLEIVSEVTFIPAATEDQEEVRCHAINAVMTEAISTEAALDIECKLKIVEAILYY